MDEGTSVMDVKKYSLFHGLELLPLALTTEERGRAVFDKTRLALAEA